LSLVIGWASLIANRSDNFLPSNPVENVGTPFNPSTISALKIISPVINNLPLIPASFESYLYTSFISFSSSTIALTFCSNASVNNE
jgi:hypothetical protein